MKDIIGKLLSILLGIFLVFLFRKECYNRNCIVLNGFSVEDMKDNIYKLDGKCPSA